MTEELLPALVIVGLGTACILYLFVRDVVKDRRTRKEAMISIIEIQQQQIADIRRELREHDHITNTNSTACLS